MMATIQTTRPACKDCRGYAIIRCGECKGAYCGEHYAYGHDC
jgi:hypothetical protein